MATPPGQQRLSRHPRVSDLSAAAAGTLVSGDAACSPLHRLEGYIGDADVQVASPMAWLNIGDTFFLIRVTNVLYIGDTDGQGVSPMSV